MYTLIKAIGKPRSNDRRWVEFDLGEMKMKDLFESYRKAYAILSNPFIDHQVSLDLDELKQKYVVSEITFNQLLESLGNKSLPTQDTIPKLENRYVKYRDAFMAGYKIKATNAKKSPDADIPKGDMHDIYLSKEGVNFHDFRKYCMVAVNGFFHYLDCDETGAWVMDGMKSNIVSKQNLIGILSFKDVGELSYMKIKEDMLFKLSEEQDYRYQLGIDTGRNLDGKTVILVVGGYFHILSSNVFYQYNDTSIIVNTAKLPLLARHQEMRQYLNIEDLPFERSSKNESMIGVDDYLSDENLVSLFTMSQSFIVLLDNDELYTEKEYIRTPPTPGLFISINEPDRPLFHRFGKIANYWYRLEKGQYAVNVEDNQWSRLQSETIKLDLLPATCDSEDTQMPVILSPGFFYKIGTDITLS